MDEFRHQFEVDLNTGSFAHLDTPTLYKYLTEINKSAGGSNPAYHAKMNHAGQTIRFLIAKRENEKQQARMLTWTQVAAIAAVLGALIGVLAVVLQLVR